MISQFINIHCQKVGDIRKPLGNQWKKDTEKEKVRSDNMPTSEDINNVFNENWRAVDRLREKYGKDNVYFIQLQKGRIIRKDVPRTTFAFNWAVANLSSREKKDIANLVRKFRKTPFGHTYESIEMIINLNPHKLGYWL